MRSRDFALCLALLGAVGGSACAMNRPTGSGVVCSVERGELLPPSTGGAKALCSDIEEAAAELGGPSAKVSVRVLSPYAMAALVTVGGQTLPELKIARSDRELGRDSLRRFAQSIAAAANAHAKR